MGLFSYNRANYQMDQKNHYTRYTAGLNMAIAQTGMYRQDISDLTSLTVTRQDVYHAIAAMGLTILTAIYCPGRLGLHTPPPPGWLMGLAFLNIAGCYMFLGLTLWLCIHAAMRAETAGTHMLTRFVRLPIPSQGMLDKSRKFLASFEEQPLKEVFRIPFTEHPQHKEDPSYNEGMPIDSGAKKRARHGMDVPAWYRKEKALDCKNTIESVQSMMPLAAKGIVPEHFEAYREIQQEWFSYDVYARLCIFLAFMHMIHCWSYMQIGHQLQETRALFAAVIVMIPMFVLQQIILTLDIVPKGPAIHRIGPFGLWFAFVAAAIEYKRWYTPGAQLVGFVLVYCAYLIHIIYTVQLYVLCRPSKEVPVVAESPGASWWPGEWRLPTAFQHTIWLVAPPKKLESGLHDVAGELRQLQEGDSNPAGCSGAVDEKRADVHNALGTQGESPAWWNVRAGLLAMFVGWIFLTLGFTVEVYHQGTMHPSWLSAPGLPNNLRDPRYRPAKVGSEEVTEVGTGGVHHGPARGVHSEAVERRLLSLPPSALAQVANAPGLADKLRSLMPHLADLARFGGLGGGPPRAAEAEIEVMGEEPLHLEVPWPVLFEPELLACATTAPSVVALSRHGRGTLITPAGLSAAPATIPFALQGAAAHGPLLAASWDESGLLLVTATGACLECAGAQPSEGRWQCHLVPGAKLPLLAQGGRFAGSVAISRASVGGMRAAVLFPEDTSVTFFSRANEETASWLPSGEVFIHGHVTAASFAAEAESLYLMLDKGRVMRMHIKDGSAAMVTAAAAVSGDASHTWPAACCLSSSGSLARLALRAATAGSSEPKLFLSSPV